MNQLTKFNWKAEIYQILTLVCMLPVFLRVTGKLAFFSEISVEFNKMYAKLQKEKGEVSRDPKGMINVGFQFS